MDIKWAYSKHGKYQDKSSRACNVRINKSIMILVIQKWYNNTKFFTGIKCLYLTNDWLSDLCLMKLFYLVLIIEC